MNACHLKAALHITKETPLKFWLAWRMTIRLTVSRLLRRYVLHIIIGVILIIIIPVAIRFYPKMLPRHRSP